MESINQQYCELLEFEKILNKYQTNNIEVYYWQPTWENYIPEPDYTIPISSTSIML